MSDELPIENAIPDDAESDDSSSPMESAAPVFADGAESVPPTLEEGVAVAPMAAAPVSGGENSALAAYAKDVQNTIVELRRLEADIRTMLGDRDPKRKRKFSGTYRWQELEDDVLNLRFNGRIDEDVLRRVQEMISRRHYFFRHLRFLSGTRPVWNS